MILFLSDFYDPQLRLDLILYRTDISVIYCVVGSSVAPGLSKSKKAIPVYQCSVKKRGSVQKNCWNYIASGAPPIFKNG